MSSVICIITCLLLTNAEAFTQKISSLVSIAPLGTAFQPAHPIELLSTTITRSFLYCAIACTNNFQCRTFVYDLASKQCALYEGEVSTGTVLPSNFSTSQVGSIRYAADLYGCYNQSSDHCDFDRYVVNSASSNVGDCPKNTYWNGTICLNQVYDGTSCSSNGMCRTDLNLGCSNITNMTCVQVYEMNLVQNGDAETGPCESGYAVTSPTLWAYYGSVTQSTYTNPHATLSNSTPGPSEHGNCYFSGFFDAYTYMYQSIPLYQYSLEIDRSRVSYNLSAWLGGWLDQSDFAALWIQFYDSNNLPTGNTTLGSVYPEDRQNVTQLVFRQVSGTVPVNTRSLQISIEMTATTVWNDASVDNISFKLKYIW